MNIVHIIGGDLSGGAAKGALGLHFALIEAGINSKIVSSDYKKEYTHVNNLRKNKFDIRNRVKRKVEDLYLNLLHPKHGIFSISVLGSKWYDNSFVKDADIINLHWVNDGFFSVKDLIKVGKPIVWTIRDMWPMTGGCHYALNCTKYKSLCGACPELSSSNQNDISRKLLLMKQRYLKDLDITCVGLSRWASELVSSSTVFENKQVRTIPNSISHDKFTLYCKEKSKVDLGLPVSKKIVLFGAQKLQLSYKGYDLLETYIKKVSTRTDIQLVCFGDVPKDLIDNHNIISFGFINNSTILNKLYSASDVFIAFSKMETFCKTIAESMCSGTPVVAFDYSGPVDIIDHKVNGYLAKPYSIPDFINGVDYVLQNNSWEMRQKARGKILDSFSPEIVAIKYIELYRSILGISS